MAELVKILVDGKEIYATREEAEASGTPVIEVEGVTTDERGNQFIETGVSAAVAGRQAERPEDVAARNAAYAEEARYSDRGLEAGLGAFANTVTLGASDVVADALGADVGEMDRAREYNPNWALAGTLAGVAASIAVPTGALGAAGKLGKAAAYTPMGALSRGALAAGEVVGGGVRGLATAGAIEGGTTAGIQYVSDALVGRKDFAAEALLSEIGTGSLIGGVIGGAAGVVEKGASKAGNAWEAYKARKATEGVAEDAAKAAKAALRDQKAGQQVMKSAQEIVASDDVIESVVKASRMKKFVSEREELIAWDRSIRAKETARHMGEDVAKEYSDFKATLKKSQAQGPLKEFRDARGLVGEVSGDMSQPLKMLNKESYFHELRRGNLKEAAKHYDEQYSTLSKFAERYGYPQPPPMTAHLDAVNPEVIALKDLGRRVKENPLWAARSEQEAEDAVDALSKYKAAMERVRGESKQVNTAARRLDDALAKMDPESGFAGLADENQLKLRLTKAWAKERMIDAVDAIPKADSWFGKAKRQIAGDGDTAMVLGAIAFDGAAGALTGMFGLRMLARSEFVKGLAKTAADKAITGGARAGKAIPKLASAATRYAFSSKDYTGDSLRKQAQELQSVVNNSEEIHRNVRAKIPESFASQAVHSGIAAATARTANYLLSVLPKPPPSLSIGLPNEWRPPESEVQKWESALAVADNPFEAFHSFSEGRVSPTEAEALRECWPELHSELVSNVVQNLGELRGKLAFDKQINLSVMIGVPVASIMQPSVIAALQATNQAAPVQGMNQANSNSKQGEMEATKAQNLAR